MRYPSVQTDLYELTMLAGYLDEGMAEKQAVFDLFFRTNPLEGGYAFFSGACEQPCRVNQQIICKQIPY